MSHEAKNIALVMQSKEADGMLVRHHTLLVGFSQFNAQLSAQLYVKKYEEMDNCKMSGYVHRPLNLT